jgi:hypothetical protein
MTENETRIRAQVVGPGVPGHLKVILGVGSTMLDSGVLVDLPVEMIPSDCRLPNKRFIAVRTGGRCIRAEPEAEPPHVPWHLPWRQVSEPEVSELEKELRHELPDGHVLSSRYARAIGRRVDNDEVLYFVDDGVRQELAVVHLTWRAESVAEWPHTVIYRDVEAFSVDCLGGKDE